MILKENFLAFCYDIQRLVKPMDNISVLFSWLTPGRQYREFYEKQKSVLTTHGGTTQTHQTDYVMSSRA
jgi:hypothetical protein